MAWPLRRSSRSVELKTQKDKAMKIIPKGAAALAATALLVVGVNNSVHAVAIGVDVVLADDPGISTSDASVDFSVSGSTLTIVLQNVLAGGPGGADGLLTGLAFDLPDGYAISSGTALATGSTVVGNINPVPGGNDVSGEWGYQNGSAGHFNGAGLAVDTQVSTMVADTSAPFSGTGIDNPANLSGPDYGLLAVGGSPGGLAAVQDSITITLTLNNSVTDATAFLDGIDGGVVAVTYGSPISLSGETVPDASTTSVLLGMALLGIEGMRRRLKK